MLQKNDFRSILNKMLIKYNVNNILLVTGRKSFEQASNYFYSLKSIYCITHLDILENFPTKKKVYDLVKNYSHKKFDIIIGIGGGKVIDYAKLISLQLSNFKRGISLTHQNNEPKIPIIAIPTTAGSGSESTSFAVIYDADKKYSLNYQNLLPKEIILDENLILSCDKKTSAVSGMDALCQSIESIWAVNSTNISLGYAKESLTLILDNLVSSIESPTKQNKKNMLYAANLSGRAINISKTTGPHALSYYLTTKHNIPHGEAVSIFINQFLKYNYSIIDLKKKKLILDSFKCKNIDEVINKISGIKIRLGIKRDLSSIDNLNIDKLIENVNEERLLNNPGKLNSSLLKKILNNY